jgi:hypothetical protein
MAHADVALQQGIVERFALGVCLESEGEPIAGLVDQVRYRENDVALSSPTLRIPALVESIPFDM